MDSFRSDRLRVNMTPHGQTFIISLIIFFGITSKHAGARKLLQGHSTLCSRSHCPHHLIKIDATMLTVIRSFLLWCYVLFTIFFSITSQCSVRFCCFSTRGVFICVKLLPVFSSVDLFEVALRRTAGANANIAATDCAFKHINTAYQKNIDAVGLRNIGVTKKNAPAMIQMINIPLTVMRTVV